MGVELTTNHRITALKPMFSGLGAANASVAALELISVDEQLQAIIDAWPALPADVRKMISGVVRLTPKEK